MILHNATVDTILERRSVRRYAPQQITPDELETILEAGRSAPSGMNQQSAIAVAVQSKAELAQLAELAKAAAQGIPVVRSSHAGSGSVISAEASYEEEGFICGGSLSPQKARILLQLSLSKTGDFRDIQKIFDRY